MAVNIPVINRAEPAAAMPKNDRINLQVKDNASMIMSQTNQVVQVGNEVGEIYQNYENDKIEQLSNKVDQEYSTWMKGELQRVKNSDGDPTVLYKELDERAAQKRQEIAGSVGNVSDRVNRHVSSRFNKAAGTRQLEMDYQRGAQQETYDNNQFEAAVKFKKNDLPKSAGYVQAGDPSSFSMIDQGMTDIKNTIVQRSIKKGSATILPEDATSFSYAYKDDDGKVIKVKLDDVAKGRIAKELSEGVQSSIDTLISGGRIQEAQAMKERYAGYIDGSSAAKIEKKFQTAGRKDEAYNLLGSMRGLSEEAQLAKVEAIKDPELRSEVLKVKDADDRRLTAMKERKATANYNTLASSVMEKMGSANPYFGMADLENDPLYKQTWDNLNPKQKKAVTEMVETPKETNPKAMAAAYDLLADPDYLESATMEDFMEKTAGLSRGDKSKVIKEFQKLQNPSASQERQVRKSANEIVKTNLLLKEKIFKNDRTGRLEGDDEITLLKYQDKVSDWVSSQKVLPSQDQIKAYVKEAVAYDLEDAFFNRTTQPAVKRTAGQVRQTVSTMASQAVQDPGQAVNYKMQFRAKNGYIPRATDPVFIKFVQDLQR